MGFRGKELTSMANPIVMESGHGLGHLKANCPQLRTGVLRFYDGGHLRHTRSENRVDKGVVQPVWAFDFKAVQWEAKKGCRTAHGQAPSRPAYTLAAQGSRGLSLPPL